MKRINSVGVSLTEMCVAIVILGLTAQATVQFWKVFTRQTIALEDKSYASMKARQMFEELLAQSNGNPANGLEILDSYNDGSQYNLMLTTDKLVTDPGNPLSGNRLANGHWRYLRQVQVNPVNNIVQSRQVVIRVWNCASDHNPLLPGVLLATLTEMVLPEANSFFSQTFPSTTVPSNPQTYPYSDVPSSP